MSVALVHMLFGLGLGLGIGLMLASALAPARVKGVVVFLVGVVVILFTLIGYLANVG